MRGIALRIAAALALTLANLGCEGMASSTVADASVDAGSDADAGSHASDAGLTDAGPEDGGVADAGTQPEDGGVMADGGTWVPLEKTGTHHRRKKLIQFGWDTPSAEYLQANLSAMEAMPFDGVTFYPGKVKTHRSQSFVTMFDPSLWDDTRLDTTSILALRPVRFTDNFALLFVTDGSNISWWDDAAWTRITANMKRLAELAKAGGLKGLFWDTEDYGVSPWNLERKREGHSEAELAAQMRLRGQQVMRAWQEGFPEIKIMTSVLLYGTWLGDEDYRMQPAFINGLLDVMEPTVTLIEAHEYAYYWTTTHEWFRGFNDVRTTYRNALIDPANHAKYDAQVQVGTATYANYSGALTPEQQRRYEHHLFMGLAATDEYQFYFHETFAFWPNSDNPLEMPITSQTPWPGIVAGIENTRALYESGERLGYDLENGAERTAMAVHISAPLHQSTQPSTFTVTVSAPNADRVRIYRNGLLVQELVAPPFELTLTHLEPGPHALMARARLMGTSEWGTSGVTLVEVAP